MKTLAVALAVIVPSLVMADLKVGTVDMMTLVRNHKSYDSNKKLLSETEKDYHKRLDKQKEEVDRIQEEGRKLAEQARNPMLAAAAKQKLEQDLTDVQNRFLAGQQRLRAEAMRSQQELQDLEGRLLKATTEDLRNSINAFAKKSGYDFIFDASAAPFAKESFDVTGGVLKEMGVDPAAVKPAKAEAEKK